MPSMAQEDIEILKEKNREYVKHHNGMEVIDLVDKFNSTLPDDMELISFKILEKTSVEYSDGMLWHGIKKDGHEDTHGFKIARQANFFLKNLHF